MIWETFLPRLFFRNTKTLSPIVGALSTTPIKKAGLGLLNLVTSAQEKYLISQWWSAELVPDVTGGGALSNADHLRTLGEERRYGKGNRDAAYKTKIKGLVRNLKGTAKRLIIRAKNIGARLSVRGTTVSSTVLYATELGYFLCTRYNFSPLNLQIHCNGCGTDFGVTYSLRYIIGVLGITRHNKILNKLLYLFLCAFISAYVRAGPLIHQGCTISEQEIRQGSDKGKYMCRCVMVQGLWDLQVDAIIDLKLGDADADSYKYEPMTALLDRWEMIKKDKDGKHCHNQRKHFLPFVLSVGGMLGREALSVLFQLSRSMAEKKESTLLQLRGWVNSQITITVARSYS